METMIYLAPIVGVLALLFAFTLSNNIKKQDAEIRECRKSLLTSMKAHRPF